MAQLFRPLCLFFFFVQIDSEDGEYIDPNEVRRAVRLNAKPPVPRSKSPVDRGYITPIDALQIDAANRRPSPIRSASVPEQMARYTEGPTRSREAYEDDDEEYTTPFDDGIPTSPIDTGFGASPPPRKPRHSPTG